MAREGTLKEGISGVRGVVGRGLTAQTALAYARALATYLPGDTIALGRDTRVSGPMLRHAVVAGLLQGGKQVVDLGVLPVPSFQTAIRLDDGLGGGVYITASHNPGDQNGLKFFRPDGIILYPEQADEVIALRKRGGFRTVATDALGTLREQGGAIEQHISRIIGLVDYDLIAAAKLRVVVDCNNGTGCLCSAELLRLLGAEPVEVINGEPTGVFAHKPEPVPAHMGELAGRVAELGCHIGFAQDPDADRLSIAACVQGPAGVAGVAIGEEYTLALGAAAVAAQAVARGEMVSMACNYSTSRMIEEVASAHDFPFRRTPVGEIRVVEGLQALEAKWRRQHPGEDGHFAFGGEGGGGIIDPRNQYCRDSLNAMALILQGLAAFKLRQMLPDAARPEDERLLLDAWRTAALRPCEIVKDSAEFGDLRRQAQVMCAVAAHYRQARVPRSHIAEDDGIRVRYADRSWVHIRPSNTEPVIRFIAEHDTRDLARVMVDTAMEVAHCALGQGQLHDQMNGATSLR